MHISWGGLQLAMVCRRDWERCPLAEVVLFHDARASICVTFLVELNSSSGAFFRGVCGAAAQLSRSNPIRAVENMERRPALDVLGWVGSAGEIPHRLGRLPIGL